VKDQEMAMMEFSDFISDQGLMDLPLVGGSCTWSLSHDPPKWSRIDPFLVSLEKAFPPMFESHSNPF
jgi:hypothetical protein